MNDRYLFKAKRMDNGEWVEGCLFDGVNYCVIGNTIKFNPNNEHEQKIVGFIVDRESVCQYTGLTDKNGKRIWEGDIVTYSKSIFKIEWNKECAFFSAKSIEKLNFSPCLNIGTAKYIKDGIQICGI